MKTAQTKELLVEQLRKTPIVQVACEKVGISRATFYRWKADKKFAKQTDQAVAEGVELMNDLAESALLSGIKDRSPWAVIWWLRNRHEAYSNRVKIDANISHQIEELTPEQERLVAKALAMAGLLPERASTKQENEDEKSDK